MTDVSDQTRISRSISTSITIDAPITEVWRALTTPEIIKQWFFGVETETSWQVGGPIAHELTQVETVTHLRVAGRNLPSVEAAAVSEERRDAVLKDLKFLLEQKGEEARLETSPRQGR
jgi:carbon monoxide dehydrogenase subunit G